jgi:alkanesulfonate monooxygenase SsuD/methylene tetrahydromethanopterin reductase-like flavin-dependent oxidoreductase (luciferase family)
MLMQIGVGLDARLGLSFEQHREMAGEAARLGYQSLWSPAGAAGLDSFHVCAAWNQASGLETGISVVPAPNWTVPTLASEAATVGVMTGGAFILGIGPGSAYTAGYQRTFGLPDVPPVAQMRAYLTTLRGLLAGERVDYEGGGVALHGVGLGFKPPRVPVYLAALGPMMLRLAGELADGVTPNWSTPEQIAWCRQRVAEGARKVGRDPGDVPFAQYIRVCVDEDEEAARRAFAAQVLAYAMARPGASKEHGYRAHFARMGFGPALDELEALRDAGTPESQLVDRIDPTLLLKVGYFGRPAGAAAHFRRLAEGLDTAMVRIIAARPGTDPVRLAMDACRPELVRAA